VKQNCEGQETKVRDGVIVGGGWEFTPRGGQKSTGTSLNGVPKDKGRIPGQRIKGERGGEGQGGGMWTAIRDGAKHRVSVHKNGEGGAQKGKYWKFQTGG